MGIKGLSSVLSPGTTACLCCIPTRSHDLHQPCSVGPIRRFLYLLSLSNMLHALGKTLWLPSFGYSPYIKKKKKNLFPKPTEQERL